ncbi:MAG TPA: alpha/beta hydrolase-fold protein [Gemmataceae bacterium]|nr:alpha/beta hydrolase-fold protein [Gemmataceae bacterium]
MSKHFKFLGLAALGAAVLLAFIADTQGQDKGAPKKDAPDQPPQKKGIKGPKGGKGVKSPEVSADGTVTFRLPLPNLQKVELDGDFKERGTKGTIPMTKDANGWTATVKVPPGSYQYWFIADGFTMPDPSNTHVRPASGVFKSQFEVPGADIAWMAVRDVPHGTLHEHTYFNKDNATYRRVVVYTPPGYETSPTKTYPVLYLLHGANDFERGWTQAGRANWIMDNLIADGKAVPMIVVMPFGHATSGSAGKAPEVQSIQSAKGVKGGGWTMEKDVLNNVIPLVEKEFRAMKDKEHRAIIGYSMGGGHSTSIGLNHPELFTYVGGMSGYTGEGGLGKLLADPAKANKDYKLIYLACGTDDGAINGGRTLDKVLTAKGIKHQWTESPGYRHDYQCWRIYLKDFAVQLFKD